MKLIKENIDTEVEVFIHGAMCTSYSGRCVMSNYVTLRDSNRGGCSQVCRFTFDNNTPYEYCISSKDLNMIDNISDMMDMGIESYKVEGRMKSMYYIATVANSYRTIMDKKINNTLTEDDIKLYIQRYNKLEEASREFSARLLKAKMEEEEKQRTQKEFMDKFSEKYGYQRKKKF